MESKRSTDNRVVNVKYYFKELSWELLFNELIQWTQTTAETITVCIKTETYILGGISKL